MMSLVPEDSVIEESGTPPPEVLLKRVHELEESHAHMREEMAKLLEDSQHHHGRHYEHHHPPDSPPKPSGFHGLPVTPGRSYRFESPPRSHSLSPQRTCLALSRRSDFDFRRKMDVNSGGERTDGSTHYGHHECSSKCSENRQCSSEKGESGSCATVYHGLWFGSDVAIKVFTQQEVSREIIHSYQEEVAIMKRLRHPNILLFMGTVASSGRLCIVTEFLPRGSLFRILQRNTPGMDWRRRTRMALDIARGMNYLHHCHPPIVHCDLKSSNLLVDKNWTVKVGDFGLSCLKNATFLTAKSGKGTVVGAVGFMNRRLQIPEGLDPQWTSIIESCWHSDPGYRPTFQELTEWLKDLQKQQTGHAPQRL